MICDETNNYKGELSMAQNQNNTNLSTLLFSLWKIRLSLWLSPKTLGYSSWKMYLMVPKVRQGGYIPFFVNAYKRSEAALVQVVLEASVNGVSTRKIERLAKQLGIEGISRSQVSEMTKSINEQVDHFRNRALGLHHYPMLWTDALYEDVRIDGQDMSSVKRSSLSVV